AVLSEDLRETDNAAQRGAQVVRYGVAERFKFLVGFLAFLVQFLNELQLLGLRLILSRQVLRLVFDQLRLSGQLDKESHLRFEHLRDERQKKIVHRPDVVAPEPVQIRVAGAGDENNRSFFKTRPAADKLGRLESIHLRHVHVEQTDREILSQQALQRRPSTGGRDHRFAQFGQDRLVGQQFARL